MTKTEFYDIIKQDKLRVSISKKSHFSIGTSPYYAHQHGLAIDIYQNLKLKNYEVLSPISGKIEKIKTLRAPKAIFSDGIDVDHLILVSNPSNTKSVWKIMHVNPYVKEGDIINIGDPLGKTIRNGYFAYWSSPHLHLELRDSSDPIRARGGKGFSLAIERNEASMNFSENKNLDHIPVKIHSVYPEMILAQLPKQFYHNIPPIYGIKTKINNLECILDGGIPHYKIGTVIFTEESSFDIQDPVFFGPHKIGILHEINGYFGFLKFKNVKFVLNNIEIRGISLYLANFLPMIKIVPFNKNEFSFEPKSIQHLKLISSESL